MKQNHAFVLEIDMRWVPVHFYKTEPQNLKYPSLQGFLFQSLFSGCSAFIHIRPVCMRNQAAPEEPVLHSLVHSFIGISSAPYLFVGE